MKFLSSFIGNTLIRSSSHHSVAILFLVYTHWLLFYQIGPSSVSWLITWPIGKDWWYVSFSFLKHFVLLILQCSRFDKWHYHLLLLNASLTLLLFTHLCNPSVNLVASPSKHILSLMTWHFLQQLSFFFWTIAMASWYFTLASSSLLFTQLSQEIFYKILWGHCC